MLDASNPTNAEEILSNGKEPAVYVMAVRLKSVDSEGAGSDVALFQDTTQSRTSLP